MKPTDKQIHEAADKYVFVEADHNRKWSNNDDTAGDNFGSFKAGANWAISQIQPEWVSVAAMTIDQKTKLNRYNPELILCQFDNGQILRYNEDMPFAVLTDVFFIPQPPTK